MNTNKKAYYSFSDYLKEQFGQKVYKITIDAGFSCPNRDGKISKGGCIFCDDAGSFSRAHSNKLSVREQVAQGIKSQHERFGAEKFLAYFQAFSNTYASVDVLEKIYHDAFYDDRVVGITIGTRPDCVDEAKLDLIASLKNPWLELGLQSIHDETLKLINRGHNYECFLNAYKMAKERNIKVCVHMILGLPSENREMMLESAKSLAALNIDGIKLHVLTVLNDARLAKLYKQLNLKLLSMEEYCNLVCDFLEILPPTVTIQRLAASGYSKTLIAPKWANKKFETLNMIDNIFKQRQSYQGKMYDGLNLECTHI